MVSKEHGVSLGGGNVLKLSMPMAAHMCEHSKTHRTAYFEGVNCILHE